jgi:hypothetical protein
MKAIDAAMMAALTNAEKNSTLKNKEGVVMIASHRTLATIVSSISTLLLILSALPAKATPDVDELIRTYPATMCQVWGHDVVNGVDVSAGYSQFGKLANKHRSKPLNVVCPIIRKENFGRQGLAYVRVWFLDRHPLIDLTCTVYSADVNGETVYDMQTASHSGASEEFAFFNFLDIDLSVPHDPDPSGFEHGSLYTLFCSIPPRVGDGGFSWLGSYIVREMSEPQ